MHMSMSRSAVADGPVALEPLAVPPPPAGATPGTPVRDLLAGARAMAPWLVGIVPYGLVIGVSAARADIPTAAGWLTAPLVYSGSAQVATIELLDAGAAPLVVVATALVINLRLVLYSATMAQHWQGTPRWWRALAAYLLVDPSVAVGVDGYRHATDRSRGHLHYIGGAALLWVVWLVAIGVGATAGTHLPAALRLDFVIPLFLAGEVAARLDDGATRAAVAVAVVVAVGAVSAPMHAGVMLAIAAGVAAGLHTQGSDR
jgi:predicted branched-subunit amino acid permease